MEGHPVSTRGYIRFVASGQSKDSYSHCDSMPYGLGITVLHWLRRASRDPGALREAITNLKLVGGGTPGPTEADVARFRVYADPDVGDPNESWYALLRYTQADPATILDCGYTVEDGEPGGWTYVVNCDDQTFSVDYCDDERVTWPWSALPADRDFLAIERRLDPDDFW
jgi:hypothetical protein